MDLSINNIKLNKNNINFKGLEGAYNKDTAPVFKFYAPAHKKNEKVFLEFAPVLKDEKTAQYNPPKAIQVVPFGDDDIIQLPQEAAKKLSTGFAYRYKVTDENNKFLRYEIDPARAIEVTNGADGKPGKMNIVEQGRFYGITPKGGTMRHSFLDSDVRLDAEGKKLEANAEFVRNHFNKLGGSIAGLSWLLKNTDELAPYRYFMTTPDIGADKVSSHKYWPANHYQCSNLEAFKDFNFECFKQGKGYVADGAFTSQGLQSPLVQHVLKWGEKSPYYNWLKIESGLALGVLPDIDGSEAVNPYNHIGIRLVNGKNSSNYDQTKPTYIQFYDDRLLSEEKINSGKLEFDYDKAPDDHYEITSHQDSVQPYAFEINPNSEKAAMFGDKVAMKWNEIPDIDKMLTFPNYRIVEKANSSGATFWDGNVDIIKMNLSNPDATKEDRQGFFEAREYLYGVADYWTSTIQSHLILETASQYEFKDIAKNNGISENRLKEIEKSIADNTFVSTITKNPKETKEIIKNFPLQTLETSEELSAIFAQPQFKKEFLTDENIAIISQKFDEIIDNSIPEFGNSDEYKAYVKNTYGNEILRYIFASLLNPNAVKDGEINLAELNKVTLKSLEKHKSSTPEDERMQVISKMNSQLAQVKTASLTEKIKMELTEIELIDFKLAEAIVLQGKGGLNWRFDAAKDIGDLDAVRDGQKTFDEIWNGTNDTPGVQDFWTEFVSRIKKYHPAAYTINEVTTLGDFYSWKDEASMRRFDNKLANAYYGLSESEQDRYENHVPYAKQIDFLSMTNSTATSEYDKGFNKFSVFSGVNPENTMNPTQNDYFNEVENAGNLAILKEAADSLMKYNYTDASKLDHAFDGNHDKPAVLHTLPLDMSIYMSSDLTKMNPKVKSEIETLTGRKDLENINPKAVAVGLAMLKTIEENYSSEQAKQLKTALQDLVNGKKDSTSKPSYKRAESFGVKPYEITIRDLIKNSGIEIEKNIDKEVLNFHYAMLKDSLEFRKRSWQVMNAFVGTPTIFGGTEFAQTGYETPNKNVYLGIRNEVLHDVIKQDERYKAYYQEMQNISSMYKNPNLSALRDGVATSLEMTSSISSDKKEADEEIQKLLKESGMNEGQFNWIRNQIYAYINSNRNMHKTENGFEKETVNEFFRNIRTGKTEPDQAEKIIKERALLEGDNITTLMDNLDIMQEVVQKMQEIREKEEVSIWPIYKKDATGSQVISVVTNLGMPNKQASFEVKAKKIEYQVENILLKDKNGNCPLDEDTIVELYDSKDQLNYGEFYAIKNGKITLCTKDKLGKIVPTEKPITLKDTVSTFYVKKK